MRPDFEWWRAGKAQRIEMRKTFFRRKQVLRQPEGGKELSLLEEELEGLCPFFRKQGTGEMTEMVKTREKFECRSINPGHLLVKLIDLQKQNIITWTARKYPHCLQENKL